MHSCQQAIPSNRSCRIELLGGLGGDGLLELLDEPKDDGLIEDCLRIDRLVTQIGKKMGL